MIITVAFGCALVCFGTAVVRIFNDRADAGLWAIAGALFLAISAHVS